MAPSNYEEPTFGQRFAARLVDGIVMLVPITAMSIVTDGGLQLLGAILIAAVYEIGMTVARGQTLGKRAFDIRIIDAETGDTPDLQQLAVRWLVLGVIATVLSTVAPGPLGGIYDLVVVAPILQPPLHRGLHDRAGGTLVTRVH